MPDLKARDRTVPGPAQPAVEPPGIPNRSPPENKSSPGTGERVEYPQSRLRGTATVNGDIVGPVLPEAHWESLAPP